MTRKQFDQGYARLWLYMRKNPGFDIQEGCKTPDGYLLGEWIREVREDWQRGDLLPEYIEKLETVGLSKYREQQSWESMYRLARIYVSQNDKERMNITDRDSDGAMIGAWIDRQKRLYRLLSDYQKRKLSDLGVILIKQC